MSSSPKKYAEGIHKYSQHRLLSHTRDACEKFLYQNEKKNFDIEIKALKNDLEKSDNDEDTKNILLKIKKLKDEFSKHSVHITITYSNKNTTARTVRKNNGFSIVIPTPNFESKDSITEARSLIAHELGHIVMHTKELLSAQFNRGSYELNSSKMEEEANNFSMEILNLKKDYYKKVCDERIFH